jgi:thiosulfate dehydrogenase (quinone)
MSTLSFTSAPNVVRSANNVVGLTEAQRVWRTAALALLSVRVIQGFIYWGGGSRRFIYSSLEAQPRRTHLDGE